MSEKKSVLVDIPTIRRWKPDHRYREDKFEFVTLNGFKSTEKSLTNSSRTHT